MSHRVTQIEWPVVLALVATWLGAACSDGNLGSLTGTLQLSVTTSGVDLDPNGYSVTLDSGVAHAVPSNGTLMLDSIYAGPHLLTVQDIAANCTVADNPRTITVPSGGTLAVGIAVTCVSNTGTVAVWIQTTGEDLDPDGYTLDVDDSAAMRVSPNSGVTVGPLAVGPHTLSLAGVAGNCSAATPSVAVDVSRTVVQQVTFDVACSSNRGTLQVAATTAGSDLDADGYAVLVDGATEGQVPANGVVTVPGVLAGQHTVALSGVAWNCTDTTLPLTVTVTAGQQSAADFTVTCAATPHLRVTTTTTGVDLDANGYWLTISDSAFPGVQVRVNGDTVLGPVHPGAQTVQLGDIAGNCQLTGGASQSVTVAVAETAAVSFDVTCTQAQLLAFVREDVSGLATVQATGSDLVPLTSSADYAPAWSPDGGKLAFLRSEDCGGFSCTNTYVASAEGSGAVDVLPGGAGTAPTWLAWKPDGTRIAFAGTYDHISGLYVMNPDGSNVALVVAGVGLGHPSWSPDGSRLVVECTVEAGNQDLCLVNADGTGFARLTADPGQELQPAWSPDGTRILFVTSGLGLRVVNPDGSGMAPLASDWGAAWPAWSADGRHIAYVEQGECDSWGCGLDAIIVANADGSGPLGVNYAGTEPAWRP